MRGVIAIPDRIVREGLTTKWTFESRLGVWGAGTSHMDIWGTAVHRGEVQCKGPEVGTCLAYLRRKEQGGWCG